MDESIRVLHVEDDPGFADLTRRHLNGEPIEVDSVTRAAEGLERLCDGGYDCVISDYEMPGMNGVEFLEAVREVESDLPFILFTGKGSEAVASDAVSARVTDYLQKRGDPEQFRILEARVREAVASARTRAQNQRLREALEIANEGISLVDENGEFIFVNEAFADIYGYEPAELLGASWRRLHRDDDALVVEEELFTAVDENGYWHGRTTGVRADGSTFEEDHRLARTATGEYVCTVRDVTDEVDYQRDLERQRRQFAMLFEQFPEPTIAYDFEGDEPIIRSVNDAFVEVFGYDQATASGRSINDLIVPEDRMDSARSIDAAVRDGAVVDEVVSRRTVEGDRRFKFRDIPIDVEAGPDGYAVYIDIAERTPPEPDA
ncbi:MAG: PAS domain S-box protein [Halobacteriota archaeon]